MRIRDECMCGSGYVMFKWTKVLVCEASFRIHDIPVQTKRKYSKKKRFNTTISAMVFGGAEIRCRRLAKRQRAGKNKLLLLPDPT